MITFYKVMTAALAMLLSSMLAANNIQVTNLTTTGQNTTEGYTLVQFDLTWENSWRTNDLNGDGVTNWDAAWVFIKYRVGAGEWQHAWLNDAGHSGGTGTGATIDAGLRTPGSPFDATTNPAVGVFIYRDADGTGNFTITGAQLRWNYGANGIADDATVDVQVFAIEMVYVPQGAFAAGSGGSESLAFTLTTINTSDATTVPSGTGSLGGEAGGYPTGQTAPDNASWPNGYTAFYSMKYEISQQQYVDFLNTLTQTQANARKHTGTSFRYAITGSTVGSYETNNPFVACNYLSWMDGAAYSDWAGLRPMTELEFEKASRGTIAPVANEYAWGNTTATAATGISNGGLANETPSNSGANAVYGNSGTGGPLRVGTFATGSSTRAQAGASYYGIMELSGNLWERPVTVGNAEGRLFTGVHGDGVLSTDGHANETSWPGYIGSKVTGATGSGFRGGGWNLGAAFVRASDRFNAADPGTGRYDDVGFRAVRSWPFVCGEAQITDIDGNTYNTVQIGTQCWMAENLKTTRDADGNIITRYCYDANTTNCGIYGGLYTWDVMMNDAPTSNTSPSGVQGICPDGWHVPSDDEWTQLTNFVGDNPGTKLKATSGWNSGGYGTDDYGFSALPGGYRGTGGSFDHIGSYGTWWSSTEYSSTGAWNRGMHYSHGDVTRTINDMTLGFSVRCLRDH